MKSWEELAYEVTMNLARVEKYNKEAKEKIRIAGEKLDEAQRRVDAIAEELKEILSKEAE